MRSVTHFVLSVSLSTFILLHGARAQAPAPQCPGCYPNFSGSSVPTMVPPAGHGTTSDGRQILNICIDRSWDVTVDTSGAHPNPDHTNPNIWDGVSGSPGAVNQWNNGADTNGNRIPYQLNFTGSDCSNADLIISFDLASEIPFGCGDITFLPSSSMSIGRIRLSQLVALTDQANIASVVGHEIGHRLGLPNNTSCGATVMSGHAAGGCHQEYLEVQPGDVMGVRANFLGDSGCHADPTKDVGDPGGSGDPVCDPTTDPNCSGGGSCDPNIDPNCNGCDPARAYDVQSTYTVDYISGNYECVETHTVTEHFDGCGNYVGSDEGVDTVCTEHVECWDVTATESDGPYDPGDGSSCYDNYTCSGTECSDGTSSVSCSLDGTECTGGGECIDWDCCDYP